MASDTPLDLAAIGVRHQRAVAMVAALNQRLDVPGAREWTWSIPARPDHDPDLVIGASLDDIPALLSALAAAQAEAAALVVAMRKMIGGLRTFERYGTAGDIEDILADLPESVRARLA